MTRFLLLAGCLLSLSARASYVPGVNCDEVGGFARQVIYQKQTGDTLEEQLTDLRQSLSGGDFKETIKPLALIIKDIYQKPYLANLDPDVAYRVFKKDCEERH